VSESEVTIGLATMPSEITIGRATAQVEADELAHHVCRVPRQQVMWTVHLS
jgi:hypothetical protein